MSEEGGREERRREGGRQGSACCYCISCPFCPPTPLLEEQCVLEQSIKSTAWLQVLVAGFSALSLATKCWSSATFHGEIAAPAADSTLLLLDIICLQIFFFNSCRLWRRQWLHFVRAGHQLKEGAFGPRASTDLLHLLLLLFCIRQSALGGTWCLEGALGLKTLELYQYLSLMLSSSTQVEEVYWQAGARWPEDASGPEASPLFLP